MNADTPADHDPIHEAMEASLKGMRQDDAAPERWGQKEGRRGPLVRPGKVVSVTEKDVFVELGTNVQGVCPIAEFAAPPEVGQTFDFMMRGVENDLWMLSRSAQPVMEAHEELTVGAQVQAKVVGANTGGLELKVGNRHAFMPASHVSLERIENLSSCIGQTMVCEVLEIDRAKKRLLLSRRVILAREREQSRSKVVATLGVGHVLKGKVKKIESFGAFVDVGNGTEGLLHVSNISRQRVNHPSDRLKVGQDVEVVILEIKDGGKRIGLGMKQLEPNPWDDIADRFHVGAVVRGKVSRLATFGAFVEIEAGLEGLAHISQLSDGRIRRAGDAVKAGESYEFRIVAIEAEDQRLGLSRLDERGRIIGSPDGEVEEPEAPAPAPERAPEPKKEEPRRGGTNLGDLLKKALKSE